MSERITESQIERLVDNINKATGSPMEASTEGRPGMNVGHHMLAGAYGGWKLERIDSDGGGVTDPLGTGYVSRRELYGVLRGYLAGIREGKRTMEDQTRALKACLANVAQTCRDLADVVGGPGGLEAEASDLNQQASDIDDVLAKIDGTD